MGLGVRGGKGTGMGSLGSISIRMATKEARKKGKTLLLEGKEVNKI